MPSRQEEKFLAEGFGVKRYPGDVQRLRPDRPEERSRRHQGHRRTSSQALKAIKAKGAPFISRGDRSGTHIGRARAVEGRRHRHRQGQRALVQGDRPGHGRRTQYRRRPRTPTCSSDRGTWLSFKNRGDLVIVVEGDKRLFNQYGVMLVNPAKHPHVKKELGQALHRLADLAGRARRRSPITRSTASSCSSQRHRSGRVMPRLPLNRRHCCVAMTDVRCGIGARSSACRRQPACRSDRGRERVRGCDRDKRCRRNIGASGTLKDEIAGGAQPRCSRSANMEHPQALAAAKKSGPVVLFARNRLCALVRPGARGRTADTARSHARPDVKLATSTPRADPSGDYAWEVFRKAEQVQAGRVRHAGEEGAAARRAGPVHRAAPAGRSLYGMLVAEGKADIFLTYCTGAIDAQKQNAGQQMVALAGRRSRSARITA